VDGQFLAYPKAKPSRVFTAFSGQRRWQIELFFKALKQNLKIKTFVGTSANAVKTQIWTALISMLLLRYLQLSSRFGWSLSNLVALLRMNLFTHRDLMA
jgi:IS4 transposase